MIHFYEFFYASPVISKPRYNNYEPFSISLETSK